MSSAVVSKPKTSPMMNHEGELAKARCFQLCALANDRFKVISVARVVPRT